MNKNIVTKIIAMIILIISTIVLINNSLLLNVVYSSDESDLETEIAKANPLLKEAAAAYKNNANIESYTLKLAQLSSRIEELMLKCYGNMSIDENTAVNSLRYKAYEANNKLENGIKVGNYINTLVSLVEQYKSADETKKASLETSLSELKMDFIEQTRLALVHEDMSNVANYYQDEIGKGLLNNFANFGSGSTSGGGGSGGSGGGNTGGGSGSGYLNNNTPSYGPNNAQKTETILEVISKRAFSKGKIALEDLKSMYDIICIQHGKDIPARKHYERPESDATVVLSAALEILKEEVELGDRLGEITIEDPVNPYEGTERKSRTIAVYEAVDRHTLLKSESYVLAHSLTSPFGDGEYPNPVQVALWDLGIYADCQMPSEDEKSIESITLKEEAEKLEETRKLLASIPNKIEDKTDYNNCTVSYSAEDSRNEFLIGPFKLNYVRSFYVSKDFSYVAKHDKKPDNIVDFSGITKFIIQTDKGELELKKENFVYNNARLLQAGDEAYQYPYPQEEFYLKIPYADVKEATKINNLKVTVSDIDSDGAGCTLEGKYKDVEWEPKTRPNYCPGCKANVQVINGKEVHIPHIINYTHWVEAIVVTEGKKPQRLKFLEFANITINENEITLKVPDLKLTMDFEGDVWLDNKNNKENIATGIRENGEEGIKGVKVTAIPKSKTGKQVSTYTDADGHYKLENVLAGRYDIEFEYDGQTYKTTKLLALSNGSYGDVNAYIQNPNDTQYEKNSKAKEVEAERQAFNDKFYQIIEDYAIGKDGTRNRLTYKTENGVSRIITRDENTNIPLELFRMQSRTSADGMLYPLHENFHIKDYDKTIAGVKYTAIYPYSKHINLGLIEREKADFALKKDVYKSDITINNKHIVYNYNARSNLDCYDIELKRGADYSNIYYNRELYKSDYTYRIDDYKDNDLNHISGNIIKGTKYEEQELKVFVTYKISVLNQSTLCTGTINEIVDYFDETYKIINKDYYLDVVNDNGDKVNTLIANQSHYETNTGRTGQLTWSAKQDGKNFSGYTTLYCEGLKDLILASGEKVDIYITFEVSKDENRGILLGEKENVSEITNYSTFKSGATNKELTEGLIDRDSNPGNAIPGNKSTYEDDTDSAPIINIKLYDGEDQVRKINGIVWEDERTNTLSTKQIVGNGNLDKDETSINGVRIQLIEKVNIEGREYEYIWREMFTGDPNYKYINSTGKVLEGNLGTVLDAKFANISKGEYLFESYIPGNYVVRFIYGDTTKTVLPAGTGDGENTISYNGQDYKSTAYQTGMNLEAEWYDLGAQNLNGDNIRISDAKDNELNRLKVIKYSETVINENANILVAPYATPEKSDLIEELRKNTWMYADTAKLKIQVEYNTTDTTGLQPHTYSVKNIDFGLEERPRTKLDLKKEIAGVRVILADGTVEIDTANGIDDNLKKVPEGSTSNPRGQWNITLDNELTNNATIEITYKITITNNGQVDTIANIPTTLEDIQQTANIGQYLGKTYYTGKDSDGTKVVISKVDTTADYVDNNLAFRKADNEKWEVIEKSKLLDGKMISDDVSKVLEEKLHTTIVQTDGLNKELKPGEATELVLVLSKRMSSENTDEDLTYDNMAEIIKYTNTVGRRSAGDSKAEKGAIPGNQNPYSNEKEYDADYTETITVMPPTGEDKRYYIIAIGASLVLAVGILFINKKILKKQ